MDLTDILRCAKGFRRVNIYLKDEKCLACLPNTSQDDNEDGGSESGSE